MTDAVRQKTTWIFRYRWNAPRYRSIWFQKKRYDLSTGDELDILAVEGAVYVVHPREWPKDIAIELSMSEIEELR